MMDVGQQPDATDVFGDSVNDFDPWGDGVDAGGFGDDDDNGGNAFGGSADFGDFGDFKAMEGSSDDDDDAFFQKASGSMDDLTADTAQSSSTGSPREPSPKRSPRKKPSSRRHHSSNSNEDQHKEEGGANGARRRAPMRRRSSRRSLSADKDITSEASRKSKERGDGKEERADDSTKKTSSTRRLNSKENPRSRSRSAEKEISVNKNDDEEVTEKEKITSGHSRRDSLRERRNSFRVSKSKERPNGSHGTMSQPRRQLSSRRLVVPSGEAVSNRQQSVRHLFQNGDLGGGGGEEAETTLDSRIGECIVSKSRFQKPARNRSGLGRGLSSSQMMTSLGGERRGGVGKSSSLNNSSHEPRRGPPQRTKSAVQVVQRPGSPPRPPSGSRLRTPCKSKSTGAISVRERRQNHNRQKSQGDGKDVVEPLSARRSHRRLGSQDGELEVATRI